MSLKKTVSVITILQYIKKQLQCNTKNNMNYYKTEMLIRRQGEKQKRKKRKSEHQV